MIKQVGKNKHFQNEGISMFLDMGHVFFCTQVLNNFNYISKEREFSIYACVDASGCYCCRVYVHTYKLRDFVVYYQNEI